MANEVLGSVRKTLDAALTELGLSWKSSDGFHTKVARAFAYLSGRALTGSKTHDFTSIADGAVANTTVTVAGAAVGDFAVASLSTLTVANAVVSAAVTAANTVTVTVFNKTGGALDLVSGTLGVRVFKV